LGINAIATNVSIKPDRGFGGRSQSVIGDYNFTCANIPDLAARAVPLQILNTD
jgi:hypothetical protein